MSIRSRERGEERRVEIDCCSGLICMVRCEMCRLVSSYVSSSCFCLIVSSSRRSLGVSRLPDGIFSHDPDTGMTSNDVRCQNVLLKYEYIYIYIRISFSSDLIRWRWTDDVIHSWSSLSNHPLPCVSSCVRFLPPRKSCARPRENYVSPHTSCI